MLRQEHNVYRKKEINVISLFFAPEGQNVKGLNIHTASFGADEFRVYSLFL